MIKHLVVDLCKHIEPISINTRKCSCFFGCDTHAQISEEYFRILANNIFYYYKNRNPINWNYIVQLVNLQDSGGLHLATKIRRRHVTYYKDKMKVRLAVQTLSASVADALMYCRENNYTDFKNCGPTIDQQNIINYFFFFFK